MPRRIYAWLIPKGTKTTYPPDIESMARYLSTQYPNNKLTNQRECKKGDKKGDDSKYEDKDSNMGVLLVHTLKILQQMKIPPLLAEELA